MPPLDRANPRRPERDEGPEIDGLSDNEAMPVPRRGAFLRGPDQLHCRWAPWDDGRGRGWVEITDPFTGEAIQVATKYHPAVPPPWVDPRYVPDDVVAEPAPQTFVYRAMDEKEQRKFTEAVDRWKRRHSDHDTRLDTPDVLDYDPEAPL